MFHKIPFSKEHLFALWQQDFRKSPTGISQTWSNQPEDESVVDVLEHIFCGFDRPQLKESGDVDQDAEGEDGQYSSPVE